MENQEPTRDSIAQKLFGKYDYNCDKNQRQQIDRAMEDFWMGLLEKSGGEGVPVVINNAKLAGYDYRICKLVRASRLFFFFQEYDRKTEDTNPGAVGYRSSISYRHTPCWDKPLRKVFRRRRYTYFTLYDENREVISTHYD